MYHLAVVLPFFFTLLSFFYYIVFDRSGLRTLGTLVPVLGVTWIFGIFAMDQSTDIFQYIFVIANSLQVSLQVWFLWLQFFLFFFLFKYFKILFTWVLWSFLSDLLMISVKDLVCHIAKPETNFYLKKDRIFAGHQNSFYRHEDKAIYFNLLFIF